MKPQVFTEHVGALMRAHRAQQSGKDTALIIRQKDFVVCEVSDAHLFHANAICTDRFKPKEETK
mgnify:FL=1